MTADAHGMEDELPVSGLAPTARRRAGATFIAPVTLGRPHWWLRRRGRAGSTVLAVGSVEEVAALVGCTRHPPGLGWRVVGACTPTGAGPDGAGAVNGCPVVGDLDGVAALALTMPVDAVAVAPAPGWTTVRLQHLARDLDHSHTALLVDPRLLEGAHPRTRIRRVRGLPVLRVDHPALGVGSRFVKSVMDRLLALLTLLLVAPVLLVCATAVRRDGGPALRRRRYTGRAGREFTMLTFRTEAVGSAATTPVGHLLQRLCLDELPQLLNVVGGSMALVGPRPSAPGTRADDRTSRRLLKPGLTGLWLLDQDDAAAYDDCGVTPEVRYVTRWTPARDVRILAGTLRTALSQRSP